MTRILGGRDKRDRDDEDEDVPMLVNTHCQHGLDLRIYPRCYLCKPMDWFETNRAIGCQCPNFWWGTVPPPCPVHNPPRPYYPTVTVGNVTTGHTVHCTCPPNRGDNYAGNCPIHDVATTYTGARP